MLFTCFGQDQNGNYGDVDQSFESLRFQILLGPDGTEYYKDLSRLLISMENRYNKDGKYDPDLLIDYPRKGQVCAVLQRTKEQKEDQCFRGKTLFCTKRPKVLYMSSSLWLLGVKSRDFFFKRRKKQLPAKLTKFTNYAALSSSFFLSMRKIA